MFFEHRLLEDGAWLLDGRLPLAEADDMLDVKLPMAEAHTVGGTIIARLRRLLEVGESVVEAGYRPTVMESSETRILKVRVERLDTASNR